MRATGGAVVVFVLAACGGEATTPKTSSAPVVASVAPPPTASVPPAPVVDGGALPIGELEIDPTTVEDAAHYLAWVCAHAKTDDTSWFAAYVSPTFRGSVIVGKEKGDVALSSLSDPKYMAGSLVHDDGKGGTACDVLTQPASAISGFTSNGTIVGGVVHGPQDAYRFAISKGEKTKLEEITVELPAHPVPKQAKKRAFDVDGNALRESGTYASTIGPWIRTTIKHEPKCVYEAAALDDTSSAILVHAVKVDGVPAVVRLYASSVVSESLLACLEGQLQKATADTFKGVPFDVDWLLRVMIPTTKKPDGPVMMDTVSGP